MNIGLKVFLFAFFSFNSITIAIDHAPIHGPRNEPSRKDRVLTKLGFDREDYTHHEEAAEQFKNKYFRDDETKNISLEKTLDFLQRIFGEYERNKNKAYETEFLETFDITKSHAHKALKRASRSHENNDVLDPYDLYLVPKLMEMITALKNEKANDEVEGLLDDFVRGYIPYFNPNPFNAAYRTKVNFTGALYRIFKFPKYFKVTEKLQANNLRIATKKQRRAINRILKEYGSEKHVGDFLTNDEIVHLLEHDFDISELNPGKSALWRPQTADERAHMYDVDERFFPRKDVRKTFDHVMLGGANSDKIKLEYNDDDGIKRRVKLKIGDEVHLELASSALMRLLGFHTDWMTYAGDVTFYLKNKTFENFEAEIRQKFGQDCNVRYNYERGVTDEGEEFITWRDTLYEARPDDEKRIAPLDIASWDLQNRREYRGLKLALAWLGVNDMKSDNMKTLLVKRDGEWIPEHRIHDLGVSLGATLTFTGPDSALSLPAPYGKVNQLETRVVKKKKDGVKVVWNDFCYQHRQYNSGTYYDLKWMARKIARLTKHDIKEAFAHAGMHPDMAHLYTIKMIKRRNNIVRRFELADEFPIIKTPKLKHYSPKKYPTIINGKLTVTAYEGKNSVPIRVRTWGSLVSTLLSGHSIPFAKFSKSLQSNGGEATGQVKGGGIAIGYNWKKEAASFGPFDKSELKPGITITPMRRVRESPQFLNTVMLSKSGEVVTDDEGKARRTNLPYMVEDSLTITVALKSSAAIDGKLPFSGKANITVAEKIITHRHFAESVRGAWLSPFRIHKIFKSGKAKFAAEKLRDLENIESYYSVGIVLEVLGETKYINNGASAALSAQRLRRKLFYRDQFGKLHYLTDRVTKKTAKTELYLAKVDAKLISVAGFDFGLSKEAYHGSVVDYVVGADKAKTLETHDHPLHTQEQADRERTALNELKKGNDNGEITLNFKREFKGAQSGRNLALAFVFARTHTKSYGQIEDTFRNGQVRKLFQGTIYKGKHLGKKDILLSNEVEDIAVRHGKSRKTIVEVEMRAPEKFVVTANHKVFTRKTNRKGLAYIIKRLDARYTNDPLAHREERFFADVVLPEKDEQDEYRKIYAEIKTMVDGEYLLERIKELQSADVEELLREFFSNDAVNIKLARFHDDEEGNVTVERDSPKQKSLIANKMSYLSKKRKIMANFNKLKLLLAKPGEDTDWKAIWLTSRDLVHNLSSRYYGVHLLTRFLNKNVDDDDRDRGILVYGEIRNIGDHITTLERPYGHNANLRNAGQHWGNFAVDKEKIRFVQYFLKFEDPTNQVPIYSPLLINSTQILGRLEQGQPPNFSGEGI